MYLYQVQKYFSGWALCETNLAQATDLGQAMVIFSLGNNVFPTFVFQAQLCKYDDYYQIQGQNDFNPGLIMTELNPNYEFAGGSCSIQDLMEVDRDNLMLVK